MRALFEDDSDPFCSTNARECSDAASAPMGSSAQEDSNPVGERITSQLDFEASTSAPSPGVDGEDESDPLGCRSDRQRAGASASVRSSGVGAEEDEDEPYAGAAARIGMRAGVVSGASLFGDSSEEDDREFLSALAASRG